MASEQQQQNEKSFASPAATALAAPSIADMGFGKPSNFDFEEEFHYKFWNPLYYYKALNQHRLRLNLPNPGQFEYLNKEIKTTMLTNLMFEGGRADLAKILSPNFQVMHSFQMGLPGGNPSAFEFAGVYADENTMMHGKIDTEFNLQARFNHAVSKELQLKAQSQLMANDSQSMIQLEGEYTGSDYTANIKAINPSMVDGTGIYLANYLQSITPKFSIGSELLYQCPMPKVQETSISFAMRYQPSADRAWVAQTQGTNILTTSYWRKVSEKCEAGAELQVINVPSQGRREANCSVGVKYDFAMATFRAMADNFGKVQMLLEEKIAPGFSFLLSGELDHLKGENKFGIGINLES
ncbi:translocase of outer mitochondrial membrane [Coemansia erecta]|uniref:Translocase of outer mitochondrial membrane n=1 Tax=Coemansia asiatica TaxID=1052880 RepID=A0A9W7XMH8_9FUNG|nr:translocase of outer mitochondrial membrane [Coemansia asiatica]KAJ2841971.1 translocase of outer mitochondrial membrane [Coemansia erecta]KAJ2881963.1 translocase of outer mitochondrial membrane [Coemansia asiatica]